MTAQAETPRKLYASDAPEDRQRRALRSGRVPVAVYGLGKMGLPLAAVLADVTGNVVGVDLDDAVVRQVDRGRCPFDHEPDLPELVAAGVEAGGLRATTDAAAAAADASVHVVVVPTTLAEGRSPDLSSLRAAAGDVASGLDAGDVVVVESTVPPGTCRGVVRPLLAEGSGLDPGEFGLAFCPERTSSGRAIRDIRGAYPKVVGGADEESARVAAMLYDEVTTEAVLVVADLATAECVKLFEGVYRDVNIALANDLARLTDDLGVDVVEAIETANTQPYCDIHAPGVGVGGHCIPFYPHFLADAVGTDPPLLRAGREVNDAMPGFAAEKLADLLAERDTPLAGATVLLLGLAYRPGIPETRASPALALVESLHDRGAQVLAADPVVDDLREFDVIPTSVSAVPDLDLDAVVLVTAHPEFDAIDWAALDPTVVVDGRGALDLEGTHHRVYTIGSG